MDIGVAVIGDELAGAADAAGALLRVVVEAVEGLGEEAGEGDFADVGRAGEEVGVPDAAVGDGGGKELDGPVVADEGLPARIHGVYYKGEWGWGQGVHGHIGYQREYGITVFDKLLN